MWPSRSIGRALDGWEPRVAFAGEEKHRHGDMSKRVQDTIAGFESGGQRCPRMRVGCENRCTHPLRERALTVQHVDERCDSLSAEQLGLPLNFVRIDDDTARMSTPQQSDR
jgi:hypothetical protein